ncbi:MAG: energy transducer TonB [Myxococcales bacterium]|nr:energy transducer TonB [Myxococcales bacterium]
MTHGPLDSVSPFERVLHFGERHGIPIVFAALVSSTSVHGAFAFASSTVDLKIKEVSRIQCRVGENVQVEALARARLGGYADVTGAASWASDSPSVVESAGGGLARCVGQGTAVLQVRYGGRAASLPVVVDPAIVLVEDQKKEEAPPPTSPAEEKEPPPPSSAPPEEVKPNTTAAAKAGNLLTVKDEAPKQPGEEPTAFVTDPNGSQYGSGTVMKGGTADKSGGGPVSTAPPSGSGSGTPKAAPPPAPTAPETDLSAQPVITGGKNVCAGYFPGEADEDKGFVQIVVDVDATGKVNKVAVVKETPKGQGFDKAARNCLLSKKVTPGLDSSGRPMAKSLTVNLNFSR